MSLQFTPADDALDAELEAIADLTAKILAVVNAGPPAAGREALTCAIAFVVAAESDHDIEQADDLLRGDLFPSLCGLVNEECTSPFDPAESWYLN